MREKSRGNELLLMREKKIEPLLMRGQFLRLLIAVIDRLSVVNVSIPASLEEWAYLETLR